MELEKGVKLCGSPFTEIDVKNLLLTFRNVDEDNDFMNLLQMCKYYVVAYCLDLCLIHSII